LNTKSKVESSPGRCTEGTRRPQRTRIRIDTPEIEWSERGEDRAERKEEREYVSAFNTMSTGV
jgi:hypothetical protein